MAKIHTEVNCVQAKEIERLKIMQKGTADMVIELDNKLSDALFPSPMHPENGLINAVAGLRRDTTELKNEVKIVKTWGTAAVTILGLILVFLQIYQILRT